TARSSVGAVEIMTVFESVDPVVGVTLPRAGGLDSTSDALATAAAASITPNPSSGFQLTLSPAAAITMPLSCWGVRLGFLDSTRPAVPAVIGVAIDVPERAS